MHFLHVFFSSFNILLSEIIILNHPFELLDKVFRRCRHNRAAFIVFVNILRAYRGNNSIAQCHVLYLYLCVNPEHWIHPAYADVAFCIILDRGFPRQIFIKYEIELIAFFLQLLYRPKHVRSPFCCPVRGSMYQCRDFLMELFLYIAKMACVNAYRHPLKLAFIELVLQKVRSGASLLYVLEPRQSVEAPDSHSLASPVQKDFLSKVFLQPPDVFSARKKECIMVNMVKIIPQ